MCIRDSGTTAPTTGCGARCGWRGWRTWRRCSTGWPRSASRCRRRDGAADLTLTIDQSRVRLSGSGVEVVAEHRGISSALAEAVRDLAGARSRLTTRHQQAAAVIIPGFPPTPQAVGLLLAESFLPAPVADELARVIADAESCWVRVRLGMVVGGELRALPWEALPAPGTGRPLALHPLVTVYRRHETPPAPAAPGPLRILIAISPPLAGGGRVLDYERELRNVIAAAWCPAEPRAGPGGALRHHRGDQRGVAAGAGARAAPVRARRTGPAGAGGRQRPAGHHRSVRHRSRPARADATGDRAGRVSHRRRRGGGPSFAARLIARGANVVIGTETAVTDVYATRVFTRTYGALADDEALDVLGASPTPGAPCSRSCRAHRTKASSAWARWVSGRCWPDTRRTLTQTPTSPEPSRRVVMSPCWTTRQRPDPRHDCYTASSV